MFNLSRIHKIVAGTATALLIVGLLVYGIFYNNKAAEYKASLDNQYNRAFYDLLDNVNTAETYLLKAVVTGTPEMQTLMLEEAGAAAAQAESCLSLLPIDQNMMSKVSNFLVQLKDISHTWDTVLVGGGKLTDQQYKTLEDLYGYAQDLNGAFQSVWVDMSGSTYDWDEISNMVNDEGLMEKYASLASLGDPFEDYPELIYDGPFSEHMKTRENPGPEGEEISKEDAQKYVEKLFEYYTPSVEFVGEGTNNSVKVYNFTATFGENHVHRAYVDISVKGGKLCSLIMYRDIGEHTLNAEQAVQAGESYLNALGYTDMKSTYYSVQDGYVTANYSYYNNDIIYYPDMIKVKIAMDNGEVTGFESMSYLLNHKERNLSDGKISIDEAEQTLSDHITVQSRQEAVIPNNFGGEEHVYEFQCTYNGRKVLVYVDVNTGKEKDVMIVLESENGVLTI